MRSGVTRASVARAGVELAGVVRSGVARAGVVRAGVALAGMALATLLSTATAGAELGSAPAARLAGSVPPRTWSFYPNVAFAYDTFGQRYTISDTDTLDLYEELCARLVARVERLGATRLEVENVLSLGQEATRDDFRARLRRGFGRFELRAEGELHSKQYAQDADLDLAGDYLAGTARARGSLRVGDRLWLRVEDRLEFASYASRSRYEYDYQINDLSLELERQYGILSTVRVGGAAGWRTVPDSSAIDYDRWVAAGAWDAEWGSHLTVIETRIERRTYTDSGVRSPYSDGSGRAAAQVALHPRMRLRPEYRLALQRYDLQDSIYADATEHSIELLVEGDASSRAVLALGPRAEFRRVGGDVDRPYDQWSLKGSVSFARGRELYLQFTDEVGKRWYLEGDPTFYSDLVFNWSTLYLTWQPHPRLGLDLFCSLDPEVHEDSTHDTTTLLLSAAVTVGWR